MDGCRRFGLAASVVVGPGEAADRAVVVATGAAVAGAVEVAGTLVAVDVGAVVAVCTLVGCDAGAVVAGCSACWLALLAARLKPRDPPAWTCVASSDIAAIRVSLRMTIPVIWSIHLTQFACHSG